MHMVELGGEPETHMVSPPPVPPPHNWEAPRVINTAMARCQQIGGEAFQIFMRRDFEFLGIMMQARQSLMETKMFAEWLPVLQALGADMVNIQTLVSLMQQGHAGRIYADALLVRWMRKALDVRNVDYIAAPQAMQSDLRKARQQIDRPPDWHQDLPNLHPGLPGVQAYGGSRPHLERGSPQRVGDRPWQSGGHPVG